MVYNFLFFIVLFFLSCEQRNKYKYVHIRSLAVPKYTKKINVEDTLFLRYLDSLMETTPNKRGRKIQPPYYPDKMQWKEHFDDSEGWSNHTDFYVDTLTHHIKKLNIGKVRLNAKFFQLLHTLKYLEEINISPINTDMDTSFVWDCCGKASIVNIRYKKPLIIRKHKKIKKLKLYVSDWIDIIE